MQRLKRALIWLSRIRHVRGFGIQSPTDYRFERYVINEHDLYYKYAELEKTVDLDEPMRKLCCLYFRLANYCQSEVFVDVLPAITAYADYVKAGCAKTKVYTVSRCDVNLQFNTTQPLFARITWQPGVENLAAQLIGAAADDSVIVVESIKSGRGVANLWKSLSGHPRVGVCYDLYYCGIIIICNRRYKQRYIINF